MAMTPKRPRDTNKFAKPINRCCHPTLNLDLSIGGSALAKWARLSYWNYAAANFLVEQSCKGRGNWLLAQQ
jgi:hypothetical protein